MGNNSSAAIAGVPETSEQDSKTENTSRTRVGLTLSGQALFDHFPTPGDQGSPPLTLTAVSYVGGELRITQKDVIQHERNVAKEGPKNNEGKEAPEGKKATKSSKRIEVCRWDRFKQLPLERFGFSPENGNMRPNTCTLLEEVPNKAQRNATCEKR